MLTRRSAVGTALGLLLVLPGLAGCIVSPSASLGKTGDPVKVTYTGNRSDAGWFALAIHVDEEINVSDVEASVTFHWAEDATDDAPQEWLCAHWGPRPDPGWGYHNRCRYYVPDGQLKVGAQVFGDGIGAGVDDPVCCGRDLGSDTYRLSDSTDHGPFSKFRSRNESVAYFVVYGGGDVESMSYNVTVSPDVEMNWTVGPADDVFIYHRSDFSSDAYVRADAPGVYYLPGEDGSYYVQEDGDLATDPADDRSELLMYVPYTKPDHGTDDYDAWVRLPSSRVYFGPWVGANRVDGPWRFRIPRSVNDVGDSPVVMGTAVRWLSP